MAKPNIAEAECNASELVRIALLTILLIQPLSDDVVRNLVNNHQLVYHSSGIIIIYAADLLQ